MKVEEERENLVKTQHSAPYQHGSAIGIHMYPSSWVCLPPQSHPSRLSQSPGLSSLSHKPVLYCNYPSIKINTFLKVERKKKQQEKQKINKTKLNSQKNKIMASSPITSCQIDRKKMQTLADFIFLGSKITVDGNCSH